MTRQGCWNYRKTRRSRRDWLTVGSLAGLGLCLGDVLRMESAQAERKWFDSQEGVAKSVIQIVCPGGIAAQESWNPKPEAPLEYRGPFGVAKTPIPGMVLSDKMPECAKIADKLCVVRSVVGSIPDHGLAMYHMLSGHRPSTAIKHPSVGAVVNHEFGSRQNLPGYIAIPELSFDGSGTGYLSPRYGAFSIGGDPSDDRNFQVRDLRLPSGTDSESFQQRKSLRAAINDQFRKLESDRAPLDTMDAFYQQAYAMISSQPVRDAFDLTKEPDSLKKEYGLGRYLEAVTYGKSYGSQAGMRMMLARRLVEAGARFVSLTFGGWDTHVQLREVYEKQMPPLDNAIAMLIKDLDNRGMLDSTLVWVVSEFGRTPKVNAAAGRDHWSRVFSSTLAGGGMKRGVFYGDSDATSSEPSKNPVPLKDLHATIYNRIGINSDKELMAPGDRPIEIVNEGKVVKDLLV